MTEPWVNDSVYILLVNYAFMFILLTMLLYLEIRFKCIDQQISYKAYF